MSKMDSNKTSWVNFTLRVENIAYAKNEKVFKVLLLSVLFNKNTSITDISPAASRA